MILKKKKAVIAAILSAALTASAVMPTVSAGTRTKEEAYGDSTYAQRFLSLYDDVITNGEENGYLSSKNKASGGFGVPYHAVEELIIEAPDYGHETTSEAMSYIVWMAAMRDYISRKDGVTKEDGSAVDQTNDLAKAWKTMEIMIPTIGGYGTQSTSDGISIMDKTELSATYCEEWDTPETYPTAQHQGNNGINPIHSQYASIYRSDKGLYLMHWLADVDDWYGYGGGNGKFTFINTFQRGAQESCWETVPHPCVEDLQYGMKGTRGLKGIFNTEEKVSEQYAYTNAPDAEDRAIQAVYAANRWGVGDSSISALAGKMGDQLRNNMFDKYYKKIGACNEWDMANSYEGAHYLMSWYTSWGGTTRSDQGAWAWQIGASHCHEFYQNPLAAYALLEDDDLRNGMKTGNQAIKDYTTSLQRQLEFYLWLQSANGPIAGGATSSWHGRYLKYEYLADVDKEYIEKYGTNIPTTFYNMAYQEHPVYADPGSNHWIGNQVWAIQRLAELRYVIKTGNTNSYVEAVKLQQVKNGTPTEMTIEEALDAILDRWVEWFVNEVELYDDGSYTIPATLDWYGQPKTWTGTYDPEANSDLTCEVTARGTSDLGCVSSLANTLIYYAKSNDVDSEAAYKDSDKVAEKALYLAHELLDREWNLGRDDIGLSIAETNGSMVRLFEQDVWVPTNYNGTMPNGDTIANGATFLSIRSQYLGDNKDGTNNSANVKYGTSTEIDGKYYTDNRGYVAKFKEAYDSVGGANASAADKEEAMKTVELNYHRFWHAGDILIALGTMADLYPDVVPDKSNDDELSVEKDVIEVEVGETDTIKPNKDGCNFESADPSIATVDENGVVTGVAKGETTITVTLGDETVEVKVIVTDGSTIPTESFNPDDLMYGDANVDETVDSADIVVLNKYLLSEAQFPLKNAKAYEQAQTVYDDEIDTKDAVAIINYVLGLIDMDDLGPAR